MCSVVCLHEMHCYYIINHFVFQFARQFYIAQWFRDTSVEVEKTLKAQQNTSGEEEDFDEKQEETSTEVMQNAEKRKNFLCSQISCSDNAKK